MRKKILLILLIILLFFSASAAAVRELNANQLELQQSPEGEIFYAQGEVELIYDQFRITAEDEAVYHQYSGQVEFKNNVELFYQQYRGKSVELKGNLEKEIIHLIEKAELKGPKSFLRAEKIDIYRAEEKIEVENNVYLEYNDFWAEADYLIYYLDQEVIKMSGNVRGERNGEKFSAAEAEINQKKEEVNLSGRAKVILPAEADNSEAQSSPKEDQNDN